MWFKPPPSLVHKHTHYIYLFLRLLDDSHFFFEVLTVISSINASGFGMELRQTIFFSFDEDLTSSSTFEIKSR